MSSKVPVARSGRFGKRAADEKASAAETKPEAAEETTTPPAAAETKVKHEVGNYGRYYGYRPSSEGGDPRLRLVEGSWFEGGKCLDVGCNSGKLTAEIASRFAPRSMVGIDVDADLVDKAQHASERARKQYLSSLVSANADRERNGRRGVCCYCETGTPYPLNCTFRVEDAVDRLSDHSYDAISCFSVTKWVHISHGDEGLLRFFANVHRALKPGGRFIVEPQQWRSYNKAKQKIHCDLSNLKLRPTDFPDVLRDAVGFDAVHDLGVPDAPGLPAGFKRPVFCAIKKTPPPSKDRLRPAAEHPS